MTGRGPLSGSVPEAWPLWDCAPCGCSPPAVLWESWSLGAGSAPLLVLMLVWRALSHVVFAVDLM